MYREGRTHRVPAMFEPENLEAILGPDKYEYILDRYCSFSSGNAEPAPLLTPPPPLADLLI